MENDSKIFALRGLYTNSPNGKSKYKNINAQLMKCTEELDSNQITPEEFLAKISSLLPAF